MPRTATPDTIVFNASALVSETPTWEGAKSRGVLRVQVGSWNDGETGIDVRQWTLTADGERAGKGIFISGKANAEVVAKAIFAASQSL